MTGTQVYFVFMLVPFVLFRAFKDWKERNFAWVAAWILLVALLILAPTHWFYLFLRGLM